MTAQLTGRSARIATARPLAARYRAGESIRDIAADIGRSYCYVHGLLVTAGVQFRGRGGQDARRAATRRANEQKARDTYLAKAGLGIDQTTEEEW